MLLKHKNLMLQKHFLMYILIWEYVMIQRFNLICFQHFNIVFSYSIVAQCTFLQRPASPPGGSLWKCSMMIWSRKWISPSELMKHFFYCLKLG